VLRFLVVVMVVVACGAGAPAALADACGLPDTDPIWVDFAGHGAPIPAKPGLTLAVASGTDTPAQFRAAGAATVLFDLNFNKRVGTTANPADPSTMQAKAKSLFDYAVGVTGCQTPTIALNELAGAQTPTPWSATNGQYRQNVLDFVTDLSALGARPLLSIPNPPYTGSDDAKVWWQQVSKYAVLLRQVYFTSPNVTGLYALGPEAASRTMRQSLRGLVNHLTQIGIPAGRVALQMQFTSSPGLGARAGLEPTSAWLEVVKLEALAAKEVVKEFKIQGVWSWGWAVFNPNATLDPDKALAACVWLWVRDPGICDAPEVAGPDFNASLQEGQLEVPPGARCVFGDGTVILRNAVSRLTALTGDPGYAASVLLEQSVLAGVQPVAPEDVLSAERAVVQASFGGDRTSYRAALAQAKLTLGDARAIIAARVERDRVEAHFTPREPTAQQIDDFVTTYANEPARLVSATTRAPWLGGATRGWVVSTLAPAELFTLDGGGLIDTPDGAFNVTPLGATLPLGVVPRAQAQAAARTVLGRLARDAVYHSWLHGQAVKQLATATCLGDQVPTPMATDLAPFVPFLLPS
jgi:hypothetical protein